MNTVTLVLDVNALNVILASVRKAPWEIAHPVLMQIEEQLRTQAQAQAAEEAKARAEALRAAAPPAEAKPEPAPEAKA